MIGSEIIVDEIGVAKARVAGGFLKTLLTPIAAIQHDRLCMVAAEAATQFVPAGGEHRIAEFAPVRPFCPVTRLPHAEFELHLWNSRDVVLDGFESVFLFPRSMDTAPGEDFVAGIDLCRVEQRNEQIVARAEPDILRIDISALRLRGGDLLDEAARHGCAVMAAGIATRGDFDLAARLGVDLFQGPMLGTGAIAGMLIRQPGRPRPWFGDGAYRDAAWREATHKPH